MPKDGSKQRKGEASRSSRPKEKQIKKQKKKSRRERYDNLLELDAEVSGDDEEQVNQADLADARYSEDFLKRRNVDMDKYVGNLQEKYEAKERRREQREKEREEKRRKI